MARHSGLPKAQSKCLLKSLLLDELKTVDNSRTSKDRVLKMELEFRSRIRQHVESLPTNNAPFSAFKTSPFVLMFYALHHGYSRIHQIEEAILPAKVFSSMETSAGRMVETVVLPHYGWQVVPSGMHTANSALDGKKLVGDILYLATLKSGPRCLNDEVSENFADAIVNHCETWAADHGVKKIDFTYGVLYGTKKQSNKKDWHILRNIARKLPPGSMIITPDGQWNCEFKRNDVTVRVTIRIGTELWEHIAANQLGFMELAVALLRACISPTDNHPENDSFTIPDLKQIISLDSVSSDFNVALLQRSQLEWLFFLAYHFCDSIL